MWKQWAVELVRQSQSIEALYEDNHLLVLQKPMNMPVQADSSGDMDLLTLAKRYIKEKYEKPGAVYLGLVHRLDRPVGGIVVFARTSKAAARLSADMQANRWEKHYLAIVEGLPNVENAHLEDYILRDLHTRQAAIGPQTAVGAKHAILNYRTLAKSETDGLSLLDIELLTGRHHQIRLQLSARDLPIWGDARYNANSRPGQQIALWAHSLCILHPTKRELICFHSLPPVNARAWSLFSKQISEC